MCFILESLTLSVRYIVGESLINQIYLVNRSAFALPPLVNGYLLIACIGILNNSDTEVLSNSINTTIGFTNSDYSINRTPLDVSGDSTSIQFSAFSSLYSGEYTCQSRTSGAERTVFISSK